jgi:hypothetical protein
MIGRCCEHECDISILMGYCPKRNPPMRHGPHPGAKAHDSEPTLEDLPWPKPEPFLSWANTAEPGERFTYFTGFLAATPSAGEIAKVAMELKEAGAVRLFQRRTGPEAFDYIAERRG